MSNPTWQRRLDAVDAALGLLDEGGVDTTARIDVFGLCERLGLWLAFMPLDNALGVYLSEGAGGILITTRRPVTVQRYTTGHELGHWRLGHGHAADGSEEVFGDHPAERERLAQLFAATLLMPPPLVDAILSRIHPVDGPLTPATCYGLAREAGVSYEAAVRQLNNLSIITPAQASALLTTAPLAIKTSLGNGHRPVKGTADVWPVDEHWHDETLDVRVDDEALVSLPENRAGGYRWFVDSDENQVKPPSEPPGPFESDLLIGTDDPESVIAEVIASAQIQPRPPLPREVARSVRSRPESQPEPMLSHPALPGTEVVGDSYVPAWLPTDAPGGSRALRLSMLEESDPVRPVPIGGVGRRVLAVRLVEPGRHIVALRCTNPFDPSSTAEDYRLHVNVEPSRSRFSIDQLTADDGEWAESARERQAHARPEDPNRDDPT